MIEITKLNTQIKTKSWKSQRLPTKSIANHGDQQNHNQNQSQTIKIIQNTQIDTNHRNQQNHHSNQGQISEISKVTIQIDAKSAKRTKSQLK